MTTSRTERLHALFVEALAHEPASRAAFIERACSDDPALCREVAALLASAEAAPPEFLVPPPPPPWPTPSALDTARAVNSPAGEPPAAGPGPTELDPLADQLVGGCVGAYTITRLIAAGGMGIVFEAVQAQPRRMVALKLVRPQYASTSAVRRFRLEAEVLGRLRHPGIAQVYEFGVADTPLGPTPFFAMEYVPDALPLTRYADAAGLSTRERLELFAEVCDAVQHGHMNGVIHRDLKPGNVLVGREQGTGNWEQARGEHRRPGGANTQNPDRKGGADPRPDRQGGRYAIPDPEGAADPRPDRQGGRYTIPDPEGATDPRPDRQGGRCAIPDREGATDPRPDRQGGRYAIPDREGATDPRPDRQGGRYAFPDREGATDPRPDRQGGRCSIPDRPPNPTYTRPLPCGRGSDSMPPRDPAPDCALPGGRASDSAHRRPGGAPQPVPGSLLPVPSSPCLRAYPKVIDFGVARVDGGEAGLTTAHTMTGQIIGTVQYMSPEQCDGDPHAVDVRSDVYSLGVMLYELLTGTLPYHATSVSLVAATRAIREQEPARPSTINRKLRGDVETVVLKALEKDRTRRYQSAEALARDIRHVLNREPIEARRATMLERAVKWAVRHPVVVTVGACLVMLVATGVAAWVTYWYTTIRPDHVEVLNDGREAVLFTGGGIPLHRWGGTAPGAVQFGRDLRVSMNGAGRHFAIIGFKNAAGLEYKPGIYVFDCERNPDTPLWAGQIEPNDIPAVLILRDKDFYAPNNYFARSFALADVFDPPSGPELIVAHQHDARTQTALRVYALEGSNVLWQVWMDFDVADAYWLAEPGILLVAGAEARVHWEQRGATGLLQPSSHPTTVLGIRPERGYRAAHYIVSDHPIQNLRPRWVKCLLPAKSVQRIGYGSSPILTPWTFDTQRRRCSFSVQSYFGERVGIVWAFDGDGPVAAVPPRYGGNYIDRSTLSPDDPLWLPSPERIDPDTGKPEIYWGDLPEIQWFHADDTLLDPVTRDLQLHFGVDPTRGKPRR